MDPSLLPFLMAFSERPQFGKLYTAPAALGDFCDSSGCLPGQTPLPGQKPHSILDKHADSTMDQVRGLSAAVDDNGRVRERCVVRSVSYVCECECECECSGNVNVNVHVYVVVRCGVVWCVSVYGDLKWMDRWRVLKRGTGLLF